MKPKIKKIRRKIVLVLLFPFLYFTIILFRILPIVWIRRFALFVGKKFYAMADKSRQRALNNLKMIYEEELSDEQRENIACAVFVEMIKSFFDYMAYSRLTNKNRFFELIEVEGEEHLRNAYSHVKGVIFLIPHLSSW